MKMILIRHAHAIEREFSMAQGIADSERALVKRGIEKAKEAADFISLHWQESYVLIESPLLRSKQTADILRKKLNIVETYELAEVLPEAPVESIVHRVRSLQVKDLHLIIVGHEPHLSQLGSWLLSGQPEVFFRLKKSGFAVLEVEDFESLGPRQAELIALVQPKFI